mmetsp:Transcript_36340/g.56794  ORF Transcript_36340/g.56794 Transcript_36340/m.56794 type:complete len:245 (-) Transcript_36340:1225-1959(-)
MTLSLPLGLLFLSRSSSVLTFLSSEGLAPLLSSGLLVLGRPLFLLSPFTSSSAGSFFSPSFFSLGLFRFRAFSSSDFLGRPRLGLGGAFGSTSFPFSAGLADAAVSPTPSTLGFLSGRTDSGSSPAAAASAAARASASFCSRFLLFRSSLVFCFSSSVFRGLPGPGRFSPGGLFRLSALFDLPSSPSRSFLGLPTPRFSPSGLRFLSSAAFFSSFNLFCLSSNVSVSGSGSSSGPVSSSLGVSG